MPVLTPADQTTHELGDARFTTLASPRLGTHETSVWQLDLQPGGEPVPHQVTREEIFVALAGEALASIDGVDTPVRAGDTLVLAAGSDFALAATSDGGFRALVCLPVGGQAVLADGTRFTPPWAL